MVHERRRRRKVMVLTPSRLSLSHSQKVAAGKSLVTWAFSAVIVIMGIAIFYVQDYRATADRDWENRSDGRYNEKSFAPYSQSGDFQPEKTQTEVLEEFKDAPPPSEEETRLWLRALNQPDSTLKAVRDLAAGQGEYRP